MLVECFTCKCMITGCAISEVIEAAHISPFRGLDDDHVQNGLLLRADIHTLFDLHLFGVNPDTLAVEWHPRLMSSPHYKQLTTRPVSVVASKGERPRDSALRERYARFREHSGQ